MDGSGRQSSASTHRKRRKGAKERKPPGEPNPPPEDQPSEEEARRPEADLSEELVFEESGEEEAPSWSKGRGADQGSPDT